MSVIVVGYVPKPEGRAALRLAAEEAKLRDASLVVVNSHRGGVSSTPATRSTLSNSSTRCGRSSRRQGCHTKSASSCVAWTRLRTSSTSLLRSLRTSSSSVCGGVPRSASSSWAATRSEFCLMRRARYWRSRPPIDAADHSLTMEWSFRPMVVADLPDLLTVQERSAVAGLAKVFPQETYPFLGKPSEPDGGTSWRIPQSQRT